MTEILEGKTPLGKAMELSVMGPQGEEFCTFWTAAPLVNDGIYTLRYKDGTEDRIRVTVGRPSAAEQGRAYRASADFMTAREKPTGRPVSHGEPWKEVPHAHRIAGLLRSLAEGISAEEAARKHKLDFAEVRKVKEGFDKAPPSKREQIQKTIAAELLKKARKGDS